MYTRATLIAPLLAGFSAGCFDIYQGPVEVPDLPNGPDVNPPALVLSKPDSSGNWDIYGDDLTGLGIPNLTPSERAAGSQRLTRHAARDDYPSLSPDGLRVVFQSERDGNWEIYVTDTGGSFRPIRLTDHPAQDVRPAWSPDGSTIAFASDRSGEGVEIYLMSSEGAQAARRLTYFRSTATDPDWSPDGSRIAFSARDDSGFSQVYVVNADGGGLARLTSSVAASTSPAWSRDGADIAFVRGPAIWTMRADGSGQEVSASMPNDFLSAPDWNAPEPKTIGLQLTCCDRPHGIYMHNRVNGKLMYLTSGRQPAWP